MSAYLQELADPKRKAKRATNEVLQQIPVPLYPGESREEYERLFRCWVDNIGVASQSWQTNTIRERTYRMNFAHNRAQEFKAGGGKALTATTAAPSSSRAASPAAPITNRIGERVDVQVPGPNDQQPGQEGAHAAQFVAGVVGAANVPCGTKAVGGSVSPEIGAYCGCKPCAKQFTALASRMKQLEEVVVGLHHQIAVFAAAQKRPLPFELHAESSKTVEKSSKVSQQVKTGASNRCEHASISQSDASTSSTTERPLKVSKSVPASSTAAPVRASVVPAASAPVSTSASGYFSTPAMTPVSTATSATTASATATSISVPVAASTTTASAAAKTFASYPMDDVEWKRLAEVYERENDKILLNEKAVEDSLALVETMMSTDKEGAMEFHSQIDELQASIEQEKDKRDSAVADLILHGWSRHWEELALLMESTPASTEPSTQLGLHEKSAVLASLLRANAKQIDALSDEWENCKRSSMNAVLPALSTKVAAVGAERERLKGQRWEICMSLLKCSERIRTRVKEAMNTRSR